MLWDLNAMSVVQTPENGGNVEAPERIFLVP